MSPKEPQLPPDLTAEAVNAAARAKRYATNGQPDLAWRAAWTAKDLADLAGSAEAIEAAHQAHAAARGAETPTSLENARRAALLQEAER